MEFAIIAFVLTLLLGAMLTFGFLLFGANVLQQAADVGAQELARYPYSPTGTFEEALEDSGLFREEDLVIPTGTDPDTLPLINRL
ncbi:MAG: pilus assembly protein, partial [Planctomycetaceae bacterium]|nr:pilus assembly protein [Planctomycetaceae bacterium]